MYFPFFILHDWGKRSAEARRSHCAVLPKFFIVGCPAREAESLPYSVGSINQPFLSMAS